MGFVTDIPVKEQGGLSLNEMRTLCNKYKFPVRIIDENGI